MALGTCTVGTSTSILCRRATAFQHREWNFEERAPIEGSSRPKTLCLKFEPVVVNASIQASGLRPQGFTKFHQPHAADAQQIPSATHEKYRRFFFSKPRTSRTVYMWKERRRIKLLGYRKVRYWTRAIYWQMETREVCLCIQVRSLKATNEISS